ncbi:MAG: tyrosine-type recombinase/integrase [Myxococcales bacterium]|nr:tyrosine-type recombinase/integrase [Myxococcales bacterium]
MPTLTQRVVDRAKPREARYELTCQTVRGFALRVLPTGKKAYYVRYRTAEGRDVRQRLGSTTEVSFSEARRRAVAALAGVQEERRVAQPIRQRERADERVPLVREFAERFLREHVDVRLKKATRRKYRQLLRSAVLPAFGERRLNAIPRAEVVRWHGARKTTPYEANYALLLLRAMYGRAKEWEVLPESFVPPTTRVRPFPEQGRERFLTPAERQRLEAYLDRALRTRSFKHGRIRAASVYAFRLLAHTGMRRGEVLGLEWSMIDWRARCARLPDSKVGKRTVPLSPQAMEVLEGAKRLQRETPSRYVVPSSKGGQIDGSTLHATWVRVRRRIGLDDVRLHDLRHSAASDAIMSGVPLAVVGKILGHSRPSTTQRYAHISDEALARGVEQMGAAIERNSSAPTGKARTRKRKAARR